MSKRKYLPSFVCLVVLGIGSVLGARGQVGTCTSPLGESYLDINNVRARIFNNGNLFWRGSPNVYNVPKGGRAQAMYNAGIWIGG